MANTSAPFGFVQRAGLGSSPTYEQFEVGNGGIDYNATAIYYGDPVNRASSSDSTLVQAAGSAGTGTVTLAGVFVGCKYLSSVIGRTIWSNYWPGGSPVSSGNQSTIVAWIINDSNAQFLCQSDSTGVTQAGVGGNYDFNIGTGNASNGLSGAYLIHTIATTPANYPWRLQSLVLSPPGQNGTASGAYNYAVVGFNNVETKNLTAYVT